MHLTKWQISEPSDKWQKKKGHIYFKTLNHHTSSDHFQLLPIWATIVILTSRTMQWHIHNSVIAKITKWSINGKKKNSKGASLNHLLRVSTFVGMILHSSFSICLLKFIFSSTFRNTKNFIILGVITSSWGTAKHDWITSVCDTILTFKLTAPIHRRDI